MRYAVVDLGSNTFHLLIAAYNQKLQPVEVYRERIFVGLSESGLSRIKEEKMQLGLETCSYFAQLIRDYDVSALRVIGTSMLRESDNRADFLRRAEEIFGQAVDVIDGKEEATLIYEGVRLLPVEANRSLIMDIGGGSVEFVLFDQNGIKTLESYKIGLGVLHAQFHHDEPISKTNIEACYDFISTSIGTFIQDICSEGPIDQLIGSAGSFEVLVDVLGSQMQRHSLTMLPIADVKQLCDRIIAMDDGERSKIDGIPPQRIKLIVVALLLIRAILDQVEPSKLGVSPYALKEGVLARLYQQHNT